MPRFPCNDTDRRIGHRIRLRRRALHLAQSDLGETLGVSYQQIQKYEAGKNQIAASLLMELCQHLEVPITYFLAEDPGAAQAE